MVARFGAYAACALLLTSCATVGEQQQACEARFSRFTDMVSCLHEMAKDPNSAKDPSGRVKLYLLTAEDLSDQVKAGRISEAQARVELQQLYVQIKAQHDREWAEAFQQAQRNRIARQRPAQTRQPVSTDCYTLGSTLHCTSR